MSLFDISEDRLLRSVLFMPGTNARAMEKARELPVDAIILDLEDSVVVEKKEEARDLVVSEIKKGGFGERLVVVRINSIGSPYYQDDLLAFKNISPDALLLPKCESRWHIEDTEQKMDEMWYGNGVGLWAMIETPLGVLRAGDIAGAGSRLQALVAGTNDLTADLRLSPEYGRGVLTPHLSHCVLSARSFGLNVFDGVYNNIKDLKGFRAECGDGNALGFDGKTIIHPDQVDIANEEFGPSPQDVKEAKEIIVAYEKAVRIGDAVVNMDGKMIEELHFRAAQRVLRLVGETE
jgi:citrate lyase subunit beta/citryl-CoA lyase